MFYNYLNTNTEHFSRPVDRKMLKLASTKKNRNLAENDIVLIVDDNLSRNVWSLVRIIKTYPDAQGLVHSVSVQTKTFVYKRPITKLILLSGCDE